MARPRRNFYRKSSKKKAPPKSFRVTCAQCGKELLMEVPPSGTIFSALIASRRNEGARMPYYVYAIHPDSKINRLCGSFADYHAAEICEQDNQRRRDSEDEPLVMAIYAENKTHALQRIKQIRREKGLSLH